MKVLGKMRLCWLVVRDLVLLVAVFLFYASLLDAVIGLLPFSLDELQEFALYQLVEVLALLAAYGSLKKLRTLPSPGLGFSLQGRGTEMAGGFLTAALLYGVGFGVSCAAGWVQVEAVHWLWPSLLNTLALFFLVAVFEEVLLRGILLGKLLDGGMPKYAALLLSSVLFSALHLFNPNFSWLPFLNILLAGVLLGASYIYTRNLWFPIFLHWFWNWLQGPVLGYGVSGMQMSDPVLKLSFSGPDMLSGSVFGFEGTLLCTLLMIIATCIVLRVFKSRGNA